MSIRQGMKGRLRATTVMTRLRIFETFLSPGFYIVVSLALVLAHILIYYFTRGIDSSGFNFSLNPVYDIIGRSLEGAFGKTILEKIFADGPFFFAFCISFLPVLIFLSINSVFRLGLEKKVGALELLIYGPVDVTTCFFAFFLKDMFFSFIHFGVLSLFFFITAAVNNLWIGSTILFSLIPLIFLSAAIYAYGVFISTLTDNSASAVALFAGIMLFFLIIMMGSFAMVSGYMRSLSTVFAWIVKWFSPIFYWSLVIEALEIQNWLMYIINSIALLALCTLLIMVSHFILKARGVLS